MNKQGKLTLTNILIRYINSIYNRIILLLNKKKHKINSDQYQEQIDIIEELLKEIEKEKKLLLNNCEQEKQELLRQLEEEKHGE